ncbi:glutaminase B [Gammaproteobacteria bacterium AS21]
MQQILQDISAEIQPLLGRGKVADYIPELGTISGDKFGIAVCTVNGDVFHYGDALEPFSIQSISKVLGLTLAVNRYGDALWQRVGKEPSGRAFNSLAQLEYECGIPRNPFINAGALLITDVLVSRLASPKYRMLEVVRQISGNNTIISDEKVAMSEYKHSDRNAAIAYLMKSFGNVENDVDTILKTYFHQCALCMSCVDLAKSFVYLANRGRTLDGEELLSERQSRQFNALLMTSGMYDAAGDFAYRVGMPGKSGVGGGIIAILPEELSICVWSPELNHVGNSLAGTAALDSFSSRIGHSIF